MCLSPRCRTKYPSIWFNLHFLLRVFVVVHLYSSFILFQHICYLWLCNKLNKSSCCLQGHLHEAVSLFVLGGTVYNKRVCVIRSRVSCVGLILVMCSDFLSNGCLATLLQFRKEVIDMSPKNSLTKIPLKQPPTMDTVGSPCTFVDFKSACTSSIRLILGCRFSKYTFKMYHSKIFLRIKLWKTPLLLSSDCCRL